MATASPRHMPAGPGIELWIATAAEDAWFAARAGVLTPGEHAELARIRSEAKRWRAMSARILLREALSSMCGGSVEPAAWRFRALPDGKPEVAGGLPQLQFSVSHTDEMAVVAVSREARLGVDVEALDRAVGEDVIEAFLAPDELRAIAASECAQRHNQFLRLWTLKEAYTKLIGAGLNADFAAIAFDLDETKLCATAFGDADAQFASFVVPAGAARCQVSLAVAAPAELDQTNLMAHATKTVKGAHESAPERKSC